MSRVGEGEIVSMGISGGERLEGVGDGGKVDWSSGGEGMEGGEMEGKAGARWGRGSGEGWCKRVGDGGGESGWAWMAALGGCGG